LENLLILALALAIDLVVGEYPAAIHPVVWIGQVISWDLKLAPRKRWAQFLYGMFMVCLTLSIFSVPLYFLLDYVKDRSPLLFIVTSALLFKSSFAVNELDRAARRVKELLAKGRIAEARNATGRLVSRNTQTLDEEGLTSAVVEMTAESLTDSIVAPTFYWLLLGVPGALAYRVVNTFDSRIGYHRHYEYLGKFAARLDDALNFLPARIAGFLLVISSYLSRMNGRGAWHIMWRDHSVTESPNAGWPMSAAAGALGIQLEKRGFYRLGNPDKPLAVDSIRSALRLVMLSSSIWFAVCLGITGVCYALNA
jgi:adenosylcobinamide-phosphate synthase